MSAFKVAFLISGNGSNLQAIIDEFETDKSIEICCVLSNKQDAFGLERATTAGISNYFIDHNQFSSREEFEIELIEILEKYTWSYNKRFEKKLDFLDSSISYRCVML